MFSSNIRLKEKCDLCEWLWHGFWMLVSEGLVWVFLLTSWEFHNTQGNASGSLANLCFGCFELINTTSSFRRTPCTPIPQLSTVIILKLETICLYSHTTEHACPYIPGTFPSLLVQDVMSYTLGPGHCIIVSFVILQLLLPYTYK